MALKQRPVPLNRTEAETIALRALGWIAGQDELLGRFLTLSGMGPVELHARVREPEFLAAVMDFLLDHEPTLLDAAHALGMPAERLARLRRFLPGATPEE